MLTVFDDDENLFKAIKAGANGYLLKEIDAENLHKCILEVMNGGAPMTPSVALKTLKLLRNPLTINDIDEYEYLSIFNALAEKKVAHLTDSNLYKRKKKLTDYLLYRGWESALVYDKVNTLIKK